jgi:hypothetical protein
LVGSSIVLFCVNSGLLRIDLILLFSLLIERFLFFYFMAFKMHPNVGVKVIFFIFLNVSFFGFSQKHKPFQGKLVYSIEMADTSLQWMFPVRNMVVFTNDTLVRIENETAQLGKQVVLKHLILDKSILLLENNGVKYAIQTSGDSQKTEESDSSPTHLKYRKRWGRVRVASMRANKVDVNMEGQKKAIELLYLKDVSAKYLDAYQGCPGLPVRYFFNTEDGVLVYTLIYFERTAVVRDLFGIPSDYKKVSFDAFIDEVIKAKQQF